MTKVSIGDGQPARQMSADEQELHSRTAGRRDASDVRPTHENVVVVGNRGGAMVVRQLSRPHELPGYYHQSSRMSSESILHRCPFKPARVK
jgi:hypothetical protein